MNYTNIPEEVVAELQRLWQEHKANYEAWSAAALRYLISLPHTEFDQSCSVYATDMQDVDHFIGVLFGLEPGMVFFSAEPGFQQFGGLVQTRFGSGVEVYSIPGLFGHPNSWLHIHDAIPGWGDVIIDGPDGLNEAKFIVGSEAWLKLRTWLREWLPRQAVPAGG